VTRNTKMDIMRLWTPSEMWDAKSRAFVVVDKHCVDPDLGMSVLTTFPHCFLRIFPQWIQPRDWMNVGYEPSYCRGGVWVEAPAIGLSVDDEVVGVRSWRMRRRVIEARK
jgi:hypothetical protein